MLHLIISGIYVIGILSWFFIWKVFHGYELLRHTKLEWIPFLGAPIGLSINLILWFFAPILDYPTELSLFSFVEDGARVMATLALAFVLLTVLNRRKTSDKAKEALCVKLILSAFLFSILGVFPLYWMPSSTGWLTVLRHFKTVPFFYSIFLTATSLILFIDLFLKDHSKRR